MQRLQQSGRRRDLPQKLMHPRVLLRVFQLDACQGAGKPQSLSRAVQR